MTEYLPWPICADGTEIKLGDMFEYVAPSKGNERKIMRVEKIAYCADYYGTWDVDNPAALINEYVKPQEIKHAYDDSMMKIYQDARDGCMAYNDFRSRVFEAIEYEKANAGLFASHEELTNAVE